MTEVEKRLFGSARGGGKTEAMLAAFKREAGIDPAALAVPILVCCHNHQQLSVFVQHTGARVHRIRSPQDLRGIHPNTVLYLLPAWRKPGVCSEALAVEEWKVRGGRCVAVPEAVVVGEEKMNFPARIKEMA